MSTEIIYEQSLQEFYYHAVSLIFGIRSPRLSDFQVFHLELFRKYRNIKFFEFSTLSTENVHDTFRKVELTSSRIFQSSHCKMSSVTAQAISFIDLDHKINVSDSLFSEHEFQYYEQEWEIVVKNKVHSLGLLIKSVCDGELINVPLLINEYENISAVLLRYPDIWAKEYLQKKD